jgi:peptidoglycan/xylan/chitin deacetylase (PgdA/CDA1 family)
VAAAVAVLAVAVTGAWLLTRGGSSTRQSTPPPVAHKPRRRPKRHIPKHRHREPSAEDAAVARFTAIGLPLYCAGSHGRYVALSFDDGPGPYTPLALRILRRHHARATFFVVGRNIARFASYLPRAERSFGAVGDHTWNHLDLDYARPATVRSEIARTKAALARASGASVGLFRPPYGAHDRLVDRTAHSLGLLEVLWSVDSRDSEGAPWYQIAAISERDVRPGSIILMHENRGQALRGLAYKLLPWLARHHYKTVSIPELLALDPPTRAQLRAGLTGCLRRPRP